MGTQNTNHSFVHNSMKGMMLVILGASLWGVMGIFVMGLSASGYSSYDIAFLTDFKTIGTSLQGAEAVSVIVSVLCLGILCTMVANVSVVKATAYINTTTCSILSSLEVVVGAVVGILIFHESMSAFQVIGAVIVVCASLGPALFQKK